MMTYISKEEPSKMGSALARHLLGVGLIPQPSLSTLGSRSSLSATWDDSVNGMPGRLGQLGDGAAAI